MNPSLLGGILGTVTGTAVGSVVSPIFGVLSHELSNKVLPAKYASNQRNMTLMPDATAIISAFQKGYLTLDNITPLLQAQNIAFGNFPDNPTMQNRSNLWTNILKSTIEHLPIQTIIYARHAGIIDDNQFEALMKKYLFRSTQYDLLYEITYANFPEGIILPNYYRGYWDEKQTIRRIRKFHGCDEQHAKDILATSKFIPPVSDLLRFVIKDVYNPKTIKDMGLDAEYSEVKDALPWASAQGVGEATIYDKEGNEIKRDILKDYWIAHWQLMSPTQGFEALHRLRAKNDRYKRYGIPDIKPFEFEQLNTLLKMNDYVPEQRKWLAATSYALPRIVDIRQMYNKDIIDDEELKEKLLDRGYSEPDADDITEYYKFIKKDAKDKEEEKKRAKAYTRYKTAITNAYKQGSIGRGTAFNALLTTDMEVVDANIILDAIDIEINIAKVKAFIQMVKGQFFLGLYDGLEAYTNLVQGGVNEIRANSLVQLWNRQLSLPRKMASTNKLIEWYANGWMSDVEVVQRLEKLGFGNADIILYMMEGAKRIEDERARIAAQQARSEKQAIDAAKAMEREMLNNRRRAVSDFYRHSSPALMKDWYKKGLISSEDIYNRLVSFMDWAPNDAEKFVLSLTGGSEGNGES